MGYLTPLPTAAAVISDFLKHFAPKVVYIHTVISNAKSYRSIAKRKYFVNLHFSFAYKV